MVHFFGGSGNFDSCSAQPLFLIVAALDPPEAARVWGQRPCFFVHSQGNTGLFPRLADHRGVSSSLAIDVGLETALVLFGVVSLSVVAVTKFRTLKKRNLYC